MTSDISALNAVEEPMLIRASIKLITEERPME
jgi:hypothetical protein